MFRLRSYFSEGVGFPCFAFFVVQDNVFRPITLKFLSNFSKNHTAIPVLGSAYAVISACELLTASNQQKSKPLTETEHRPWLNIICLLSVDACNRSKIRRSGALNELIREDDLKVIGETFIYIMEQFSKPHYYNPE